MAYFRKIITDKKIKKNHNIDPDAIAEPEFDIVVDVKKTKERRGDAKLDLNFNKNDKTHEENKIEQYMENIDLTIEAEIPPKFYYYKRWLWMIFPWVSFLY